MADADVVVVGAGLFGQTIAGEMRRLGASVMVIDSQEPNSGSAPSAGLIKPSWFSAMRGKYNSSIETLNRIWGVDDLLFKVGPIKATIHWVNPKKYLNAPFTKLKATKVTGKSVFVEGQEDPITARHMLIVAAGAWSAELVPSLKGKLQGKAGVTWLWKAQIEQPVIRPWAPYKQILAFNLNERTMWVGDGTAILERNWTEDREAEARVRCADAVGMDPYAAQRMYGIRPYIKKAKPCHLEEIEPGVWVATGGAKSGTVGAGWCAHVLGGLIQ